MQIEGWSQITLRIGYFCVPLRFIPPPEASGAAAAVAGEPASVGTLDAIFNAMSECAQLHPDDGGDDDNEGDGDGGEDDEDDGGEGLMAAVMRGETGFVGGGGSGGAGGGGGGALTAQQVAMLARYEAMLSPSGPGASRGGQFDDADEGER